MDVIIISFSFMIIFLTDGVIRLEYNEPAKT